MHDVVTKGYEVITLKWRMQRSDMIQHAAYRPNIHLCIVWLVLNDFWGEVQRRTNAHRL